VCGRGTFGPIVGVQTVF